MIAYLLVALAFALIRSDYVPDYDNRCWACLMDKTNENIYLYCPTDNRCYSSINDTCP